MIEINKVYNQDCLEGMKNIDNESIDMILCDLPFQTTKNKWDIIIPFDKLWEQYKRIIKKNGAIVLTAQTPFDKILGCSNLEMLKYEMIWKKSKPTGFLNSKYAPLKEHENILVFSKSATSSNQNGMNIKYNPQGLIKIESKITKKSSYNESKNYGGFSNKEYLVEYTNYPRSILEFESVTKTIHPTQKPIALFEYLIKTYTNENDLVLDNCLGSGTTALACQNTNRNFIGYELDKDYFKIIEDRVEKNRKKLEIERSNLFEKV